MDDNHKDPIDLQDEIVDYAFERDNTRSDRFTFQHEQLESVPLTSKIPKMPETVEASLIRMHDESQQVTQSKLEGVRTALVQFTADKVMREEVVEQTRNVQSFGDLLSLGKAFHSQETGYPGDKWDQAKRFVLNGTVLIAAVIAEKYLPGAGKVVATYGPAAYAGDQLAKEHGMNKVGRATAALTVAAAMGGGTEYIAQHVPSVIAPETRFVGNQVDDALLYHEQIGEGSKMLARVGKRVVQNGKETMNTVNKLSPKNELPPTGGLPIEKSRKKSRFVHRPQLANT